MKCAVATIISLPLLAGAASAREPRRDTYRYDEAGRLAGVVQGDGGEIRYERDAGGNVVARTAIAAVPGDETGDGRVSVADAVSVLRVVQGSAAGTPRADCDRSGGIGGSDVQCVRALALGAPPAGGG